MHYGSRMGQKMSTNAVAHLTRQLSSAKTTQQHTAITLITGGKRPRFMRRTHRLCHCYVWFLDVFLDRCVPYKGHIADAAGHTLKRSGKTTEWIVARAADIHPVTGAFVAHVRRVVTCAQQHPVCTLGNHSKFGICKSYDY